MTFVGSQPVNWTAANITRLRQHVLNSRKAVKQMTPDQIKETLTIAGQPRIATFSSPGINPFLRALFKRAYNEGITAHQAVVRPMRGIINDHMGETQKPLRWIFGATPTASSFAESASRSSLTSPARYMTQKMPTSGLTPADEMIYRGWANHTLRDHINGILRRVNSTG
jgi:hypothetical protein